MEIHAFFNLIRKNYNFLTKFILVFILIFFAVFFITPEKHVTEGTLYVYPLGTNQESEVSNEMNFARNIIGMSEAPEFKKAVSERINLNNNFLNFDTSIKLKEVTPNLVSLSVWDYSAKGSKEKFGLYKSTLIEFSSNLKKGTSLFEISSISNEPITYKIEKNFILYILSGLIFGFFIGVSILYLRDKKND